MKSRYMTIEERLSVLVDLGKRLLEEDEYRDAVIHRTFYHNQWFTKENQRSAIEAVAHQMLDAAKLTQWLANYDTARDIKSQTIGLVLAGNIPLVGFHDILCTFVAGHRAQIKLSDKDPYLLPYLLKRLHEIDERTADYFELIEQLKKFDAVIATGSNNSARYFEAYFGKYPNIIRKNRNAIAVLDGSESKEDLAKLAEDVFQYFGLGCRNVAKLYVPKNYSFEPLLEALHEYRELVTHTKYKNNFDYNYALLMLNKVKFMANGCIILTENSSLQSHIAGLHYEYYEDESTLEQELSKRALEIQCVVSRKKRKGPNAFLFGQAQQPALWDYADGVDTLHFLLNL